MNLRTLACAATLFVFAAPALAQSDVQQSPRVYNPAPTNSPFISSSPSAIGEQGAASGPTPAAPTSNGRAAVGGSATK
jgi:hypothetical protein